MFIIKAEVFFLHGFNNQSHSFIYIIKLKRKEKRPRWTV